MGVLCTSLPQKKKKSLIREGPNLKFHGINPISSSRKAKNMGRVDNLLAS